MGHKKRFTEIEEKAIAEEYQSGATLRALMKKWRSSGEVVSGIVLRCGGKLRSTWRSRQSDDDLKSPETADIARRYLAGESCEKIASSLGVKPLHISRKLHRLGMDVRTYTKRCVFNESIFDSPETDPIAAYLLGLYYADGWVNVQHTPYVLESLCIELAAEDRFFIQAVRDLLGSTHKITERLNKSGYSASSRQPSMRLAIASPRLVETVSRYGIVPRKSTREVPPESMLFNPSWWRGVVDGDGSIGNYSYGKYLEVCGSIATCKAFLTFVKANVPTKATVRPNNTIWVARVGGGVAKTIIKLLYGSGGPALPRKLSLARAVMDS